MVTGRNKLSTAGTSDVAKKSTSGFLLTTLNFAEVYTFVN